MAVLSIDEFKSKLIGGGARNNLFKVTLNYPTYVGGNVEISSFMVKSASLPGSTMTEIVIPFRGRQLKIAGDRTFEPWTIAVINDTNFEVRDSMERWMNGINAHADNTGLTNPIDYSQDLKVEQLDKDGTTIKTYYLRGCFPTEVSAIDVSFDTENQIEEFNVTFQVQYWESNTTN